MSTVQGNIVDVTVYSGASTMSPFGAGTTLLLVSDTTAFPAEGGTLRIDEAEVINFTETDAATNVLTLATPLVGNYAENVRVTLWPERPLKVALVLPPGRVDDAVRAVVPLALDPLVPLGIRDEDEREYVEIVSTGRMWEVARILEEKPSFDGSALAPGTIPQASTDGNPPPSVTSMTAEPGIRSAFLGWESVLNRDPVRYAVHGSTESSVAVNGDTLLGETPSNTFVANEVWDPVSSSKKPMTAAFPAYFRIVAKDDDGSASASDVVSTTPIVIKQVDVGEQQIDALNIKDLVLTVQKFRTNMHQIY